MWFRRKKKVSREEAEKYAKENEMEFIEVSAKEGKNIEDKFNSIIQGLLKDMEKEKISYENEDNNDFSFCNKYCSCWPCLKKTEGNDEKEEGGEDDE